MSAAAPATRVLLAGTGRIGSFVLGGLLRRPELRLVGAVAHAEDKRGRDVGAVCLGEPAGVPVSAWAELEPLLASSGADVLCYCGLAESSNYAELMLAARAGVDVVSLAGPTHFTDAFGAERAEQLRAAAIAGGSRMVATGLNPGFLLDTLPVICASLTIEPTPLRARRISEVGVWGGGVRAAYGIGRDPAEFDDPPHVSLRESARAICDALAIEPDAIEEEFEPTVARRDRTFGDLTVGAGRIAGFVLTCRAVRDGLDLVTLEWVGEVGASGRDGPTGEPHLVVVGGGAYECRLTGELDDPYPATAARGLNAIAPLRRLAPGLYTPAELPVA